MLDAGLLNMRVHGRIAVCGKSDQTRRRLQSDLATSSIIGSAYKDFSS